MHQLIRSSFGGLSTREYVRHLVFGAAMAALILSMAARGPGPLPLSMVAVLAVNALLYPYARFAYESLVGFVLGDNLFVVPAFIGLFWKALTMGFCFALALVIAPVGLLCLHLRRSRAASH